MIEYLKKKVHGKWFDKKNPLDEVDIVEFKFKNISFKDDIRFP